MYAGDEFYGDDVTSGPDNDAAYERHLETRYEEDPRDLEDEANDAGLQELRAGREDRLELEELEAERNGERLPVRYGFLDDDPMGWER